MGKTMHKVKTVANEGKIKLNIVNVDISNSQSFYVQMVNKQRKHIKMNLLSKYCINNLSNMVTAKEEFYNRKIYTQ